MIKTFGNITLKIVYDYTRTLKWIRLDNIYEISKNTIYYFYFTIITYTCNLLKVRVDVFKQNGE